MAIRNLSNLRPPKKANENKKRVGRGMGSGMGKTSTRGHKGQRSRSGSSMMRGFEGGQMPLHRRLPKRGFTNIFRVEYQVVNLDRLAELGEKNITPELLIKNGVVHKNDLIKVRGDGELKTALTVQAHKFSKSAEEKITKAGGKIEIIGGVAVAAGARDEPQTGKSKAPSKLKKKVTEMFEKLANIFRVPDLRKRVLFTLAMLAVYRLGSHIPTPGINADALSQLFDQNSGGFLGYLNLFSGGNFRRLTIFALGIMPYITASIILQLITVVWPYLEKLSTESDLGRRKITTYTRYLTVVLAAVQSAGIAVALQRQGQFVINPGFGFILMTMLTLTTGTAFIMWLGEQITDRGIGNGMSLIIFAGIVVGLPRGIVEIYEKVSKNEWSVLTLLIL